jgi:hypothetical protein
MLVFAHGLVGRADLPIPAELFGAAAAAVLVVSFAALAAGWTRPRLEAPRERRLFALPRAVDAVLGAVGLGLFALTVYAGLAGTDAAQDNLAPSAVYVGFWVGVPFVSLFLGDVFRLLSPWRAAGRAAGWALSRVSRGDAAEPLPYPERLGYWPAAAGLVAFGICELCWGGGRDPQSLAVVMLVYFAAQVVGMGLFGVDAWTRRGDAFGVWFSALATLAPVTRRDGVLHLRAPGVGAARFDALPGAAAVLICGIGVTAFDGMREGPVFSDIAPDVQQALADAGLSLGAALEWTFVLGMVVALALVGAIWWVATRRLEGRRFVHSLIPIGAAYLVAHYFSLAAYNGQDLWRLLGDPLGETGGGAQIDYGVVSATGIWYVQVAALVIGHVVALALAHDRALVVFGRARDATRSQVVMLAVMVGFTCLGLYLLSAANA